MSESTDQRSVGEILLLAKEGYGLTWRDIGEQLGRSEKMARKIATGQASGESFRQSITELYEKGRVVHLTPRRRGKNGQLAPVRAKQGAETKSVVPVDTKGETAPPVKRGRYQHEVEHLGEGGRVATTSLPKTIRSEGRKKGWASIKDELGRVGRSQARKDKRITAKVVLEDKDGQRRIVNIGSKNGFHASDVLTDIRNDHGGNVEAWVNHQLQGAGSRPGSSAPESLRGFRVVQMETRSYDAARAKSVRKEQDHTGRRRWGKGGFN